jgi:hypothetical protein
METATEQLTETMLVLLLPPCRVAALLVIRLELHRSCCSRCYVTTAAAAASALL